MERNMAVVGCGYWGRNLVRNFAEPGALHAICDIDQQGLENYGSFHPQVNTETDYLQVLQDEEIKGVVLATPAVLHYSMAREALLAGKDVFVEKPLALRVEEGREEILPNYGMAKLQRELLKYCQLGN